MKLFILKALIIFNEIKFRIAFLFKTGRPVPLSNRIYIHPGGKIDFSFFRFGPNSSITVHSKASLSIGYESIVMHGCTIYCAEKVTIGYNTRLGHNVTITDHDYKPKSNFSEYLVEPVQIGNGCWIGANSIILKGTSIEDNRTLGAMTLMKKKVIRGLKI